MGCIIQGVTSESFVYECALRVLFKGRGNVGRGDDSDGHGEVHRPGRGGVEHAAESLRDECTVRPITIIDRGALQVVDMHDSNESICERDRLVDLVQFVRPSQVAD